MTTISFREVEQARRILGLEEKATLREVKVAYRTLSKKWHPDKCKRKDQKICHEKMKEINMAYKTILRYLEGYCYSLTRQKAIEEDPGEFWRSRFGKDPTWGEG